MTSPPQTDSLLAGGLWSVLELVLFTVAVCLVVAISALLIGATVSLTDSYTGSRTVSSLLALLAFVAFVAVPTYLLATRIGTPSDTPDSGAIGDDAEPGNEVDSGDEVEPGDDADTDDAGDRDGRNDPDSLEDPDGTDDRGNERIESNEDRPTRGR